jgi:nitrogen regulatory protein PII
MQLKLRRSQKSGLTGSAIFILDVMAELSNDEAELVKKYKLQKLIVYSSEAADQNAAMASAGSVKALGGMMLDRLSKRSFSMNDLINGQHLECKDLNEVISTEHQVHQACKNIASYLETAKLFDGSELIIEITAAA